jgi:hypothetical protein
MSVVELGRLPHPSSARARLGALLLCACAAGGLAGCGTTKAVTPDATEEKAPTKLVAPSGDAVDQALEREAEKWMVDQAKRRAAEHAAPPAPQPAAVPKAR